MPEKQFRADVIFGGKVEPSVHESFEKFHEQLKEIREQAKEATETLKEMGESVMDFGIALLGIEEAKNVFEWLNESGNKYLETQRKINWALEEQMNLLHKGPEGVRKAKEELEKLNEEWRKGSSFSKEAIEGIEAALLAAKGTSGERLTPDAIKRLVPGILANAVKHGQYSMTEQQADAAGSQIAEFILKGGRGSLEALGITVDKSEVAKWMKEHYGVMGKKGKLSKPEELTPAEAAEFLRSKLGAGGKDLEALLTAKGEAAAQPTEVARSFEEIATRIGTSMERAFQPLARMMNIILGDDPSGKGSPLDTFLDGIDTKTKEFDNWVRTSFLKTWQSLEETFKKDVAAIQPLIDWMRASDMANFKATWDAIQEAFNGILAAVTGISKFTAEKMPMFDLAKNFGDIGQTMVKIWGDLAGIFKDLSPIITALAGTAFAALEVAVKGLDEALKDLEKVLNAVKTLMDVVFHPPAINATEQGFQAFQVSHPGATMDQYKAALAEHEAKAAVRHAEGGIFTTPHVGMVAEAGPEAIVPLGRGDPSGWLFELLSKLPISVAGGEDVASGPIKAILGEEAAGLQGLHMSHRDVQAAISKSSREMRDFWGRDLWRKILPGIGRGLSEPIPHFAEGGVVTGPTTALLGEKEAEAVIPLESTGRELVAHTEEAKKNWKESEKSTLKMGEIFDKLPEIAAQFLDQMTAAMSQMGMGMGMGMGGGAGGFGGGGGLGGGGGGAGGGAGPTTSGRGAITDLGGGGAIGGGGNRVAPGELLNYLETKFSGTPLIGYVPADGARWGIKTGSAKEWAAFGLAVAKQESDLNPRSYNPNDPGGSKGLFQFGQGQTRFAKGEQFDPQQSADAFVRSVEYYVGGKGNIANMGATFGSIRRPKEAGQYIPWAEKQIAESAEGGIFNQRTLSWLGERGSEAVIPLTRTPRALSLLEHAAGTLGAGGSGIGAVHFAPVINLSGTSAEAGEAVGRALRTAHEQLEAMLEDILRRHRREQFA